MWNSSNPNPNSPLSKCHSDDKIIHTCIIWIHFQISSNTSSSILYIKHCSLPYSLFLFSSTEGTFSQQPKNRILNTVHCSTLQFSKFSLSSNITTINQKYTTVLYIYTEKHGNCAWAGLWILALCAKCVWSYLNVSAGLFHCLQKRHAGILLAVIYTTSSSRKKTFLRV
jgi:hypothetical protein